MESIKIHINKLGRIKDSDVEIDRLMLFCGESGMGKSYVAMLCHYFFYVWLHPVRINLFLKEQGAVYELLREQMLDKGTALQIDKQELENWLATDAVRFLGYLLSSEMNDDNITVTLPNTIPDQIVFTYEKTIEGIVSDEDTYVLLHSNHFKYRAKDKGININEESPFAILLRSEIMHCVFGDYQALRNYFILPPSRGAMLTEKVVPQTGLYRKFEECLSTLRTLDVSENTAQIRVSEDLLRLMDGRIGQENDTFYYETNNIHIPLSAAASSIREIGVLQLLLEKTSLSNDAILIEEPEAHLHPKKQRMMADVIARFFNAGAYMQITTHSDYFLHRFNELLMLGDLKGKLDQIEFETVCASLNEFPDNAITKNNVKAYLLEKDEGDFSHIKLMSIDEGIPFTSFREVILQSLDKEEKLKSLLGNDNN